MTQRFPLLLPKTLAVVWLLCAEWLSVAQPATPMDAARGRVDEILTALQTRSDGLKDIACNVQFVEEDRINLTKRTKSGRISFLMTEPNAQFFIHFDRTQTDGVLGKQEWYLFDGRWFYQALERIAQVTKQEVAREGQPINLFDLESAPFPLPFGQKRETILRNFEVTLVDPAPGDPERTDHLVCVTKPDSRLYRRYQKLDLFVHRDVRLPSRIVVTKNDAQEVNTADFPDLSDKSINTGVQPKDLVKPEAWKSYKEVEEELIGKE